MAEAVPVRHALGCVHDRHDGRDYRFAEMAPLGVAPLPTMVDLESLVSPVMDQGQLGSCTGFALTGAREYLMNVSHRPFLKLSELFTYWEERKREHTIAQDSGATLRSGLRSMLNVGSAPETDYPYDITTFTDAPSRQAIIDAHGFKIAAFHRLSNLFEMKQALVLGRPVVIGIRVFESFESDEAKQTGLIPMPMDGEYLLGGHAVFVTGYDDETTLVRFKNSWSIGWGDAGFGMLPYAYFDPAMDLVMDLWTFTV